MSPEDSTTVIVRRVVDLTPMRDAVRRLLRRRGIDESVVEEIVLAVQEASKNAITFSRGSDTSARVVVQVAGDSVLVEVTDRGAGLDPDLERVEVAGPCDEHGRGIFLMRRFMDTLEVIPRPVGTVVRMKRAVGDADLSGASGA